MKRLLLRFEAFRRSYLMAYAIPILTVGLLVVAVFTLMRALLMPDDVVVIEVVPIGDDALVQAQIAGAVAHPGVYTLAPDSTLADLLDAAGGAAEGAEIDTLDLGARLSDGAFFVVPSGSSVDDVARGPLDINLATASDLETLQGVGPVIAERIVEYRDAVGGFGSVEQLAEVSGISERMVEELRPFIIVGTE